jgi:hypothetical protein
MLSSDSSPKKETYDSVRKKVLDNILIEFGIPMRLLRLINTCLGKTYSRVWVGKHLSDMFHIRNDLKQGEYFLSFLNFALEYVIRRVQVNQGSMEFIGAHQLLAFADDAYILGGSLHTVKRNTEALVLASKMVGLEVNADKTKYMVRSGDQTGGCGYDIKIDNIFF